MLFGNKIKQLREEKKLFQRQLAAALEIDTPMYSKIETGSRMAKRTQVIALAKLLSSDRDELLTLWLADQIINIVKDEKKLADRALDMAKKEKL
ncbi:MAG: helix-turn-helix transcriptional regulator [Paludibacter sp.]|nr:helix-turn-helix transcriptional regulator [Paludibacter sp.]